MSGRKAGGCRNPSLEYLWMDLPEGQGIHGDLSGQQLQFQLLPGNQRIPEVSLGAGKPHHTIPDEFGQI